MSGSAGRSSAAYKAAKAYFKSAQLPCWMCNKRVGTWVDHDPPLALGPRPWQGTFRPACQKCQSRQGAQITNSRKRKPSRVW